MIRLRRSACSTGTNSLAWSSAARAAANRQTAGLNFGFGTGHMEGSGRAQPGENRNRPSSE